jgi:hypothetical protein
MTCPSRSIVCAGAREKSPTARSAMCECHSRPPFRVTALWSGAGHIVQAQDTCGEPTLPAVLLVGSIVKNVLLFFYVI